MPLRIREFTTSRSGTMGKDSQYREIIMTGDGTKNDAVAKASFAAFAPAVFDGLTLYNINYEFLGGLLWRATAQYGPDSAPSLPAVGGVGVPAAVPALPGLNDPLGPWVDFDFTGVTEHITQSKNTEAKIGRGPIGTPAADTQRAIGISANGDVQGCDKISPNFEFVITRTFDSVSMDYGLKVRSMVGGTNNAPWFNHSARSLIFLGGNTQSKDTFKKIITFKFLARPNLTDISICDDLIVPVKMGSDYLWVSYKNVVDAAANKRTQQPVAAYVERICDLVNFEDLRIGI